MRRHRKTDFWFEHSLELAITKAGKVLACEMDYAAQALRMTHVQMCVLLIIVPDASLSVRKIANLLKVDSATVSRSLDGLERQGLLFRSRSVVDRRLISLCLTQYGEDIAAQVSGILVARTNQRFKALSDAEYAELQRLLQKCMAA